MSSLSHEISKLACEVRRHRVHDQRIIKELTMIVGYGRLIEMEPKLIYMIAFQKHLIILLDLIDADCRRIISERIRRIAVEEFHRLRNVEALKDFQ